MSATARAPERPSAQAVERFARLYEEHAAWVGSTLRYLGVREADLEDGVQEVFVVVHRRLADFVEGTSFRAWLGRIALHVAQNARRSARRRREDLREEPPDQSVHADQPERLEALRLRDRVLAILDTMPSEQRTVFVLFEIERLSMADVASAVGCPLQTAYARLYAARNAMNRVISEGKT